MKGIAVAIHDVEPATFERCALIRDRLDDHGIDRDTLLVRRDPAAEFAGLDPDSTHAGIEAGRRMLALAGVEPRGFVAPSYAYTPALRHELAGRFDWWATVLRLIGRDRRALAPARSLRGSALAPLKMRAGARLAGDLLRLDLHPADFDRPRDVFVLEAVLRRAGGRTAVTYDELV